MIGLHKKNWILERRSANITLRRHQICLKYSTLSRVVYWVPSDFTNILFLKRSIPRVCTDVHSGLSEQQTLFFKVWDEPNIKSTLFQGTVSSKKLTLQPKSIARFALWFLYIVNLINTIFQVIFKSPGMEHRLPVVNYVKGTPSKFIEAYR